MLFNYLETEVTIHTGTPKLDNTGKMSADLKSLNFCLDIYIVGSEFEVNTMKLSIYPALCQWCNAWGYFLGKCCYRGNTDQNLEVDQVESMPLIIKAVLKA